MNHGREVDFYEMQMKAIDREVPENSTDWATGDYVAQKFSNALLSV